MDDNNGNNPNQPEKKPPRRRGITSLSLGWLADQVRRAQRIRQQLEKGTYKVDSEKIAASIVNAENE